MTRTRLETLDASALDAIAALCARSILDPPTADELERTLFAPDQPATVRGDPEVGIVATVEGGGQGYLRLIAVDPAHRGRGHGRALLDAAEADVLGRGLPSVTVGADAPYYLFPGVDTREVALLCLLERAKYARTEANFNMDIELDSIPADAGGWEVASAADRDAVSAWAERYWLDWLPELRRAVDRGTLVLTRDEQGIAAACAYDVNRAGYVGPVAVRHELLGKGAGVAPLLGALHRMRAAGCRRAQVAWVGPIIPYARVGATIGRVFFVYRKELR